MSTDRSRVRPPAVAGTFYPAEEAVLRADVDGLLARATPPAGPVPKAVIAPHAGYRFSGPIAASAYAKVREARDRVTRVVLVGPSHYVRVEGLATTAAEGFATPLGIVPVDTVARDAALALPDVHLDEAAHAREHSLEVHLPFLQRALGEGWRVVPFVVGRATPECVAGILDVLWGGDETIIVISSDLSHYLDHATAVERDRATADTIVAGRVHALAPDDACGAAPIAGLLSAAARHSLSGRLLDLRDSSDTAGGRDRVVGYGAFAFSTRGR